MDKKIINGKIDIDVKKTNAKPLEYKKENTINRSASPEFNND